MRPYRGFLIAIVIVLGLGLSAPASANSGFQTSTTRYVSTSGSDSTTCTDSTQPCRTIQHAIDVSSAGDTVSVFAGTYYEHLTLSKNLSIHGGAASSTILDGSNTGTALTITSGTVNISWLTIQHGKALGSSGAAGADTNGTDGRGGGISMTGGSLSLNYATVTGNTAQGGDGSTGAGDSTCLSVRDGPDGLRGGNGLGGGIYMNGGTLTLANSTLSNNTTTGGNGGNGGLCSASNGRGGPAGAGMGGAIYAGSGTVQIVDSALNNNAAIGGASGSAGSGGETLGQTSNGGSAFGGAVENAGAGTTLARDTFLSNQATGGVNGAYTSTSYSASPGTGAGGGLDSRSGQITLVTNSTFNQNTASAPSGGSGYGGGIAESRALITVIFSTIAGNSALSSGGGIAGDPWTSLENSVLADNCSGSQAPVNTISALFVSSVCGCGPAITALALFTSTGCAANSIKASFVHQGSSVARNPALSRVHTKSSLKDLTNTASGTDCSGSLQSGGYNLIKDLTGCGISAGTGDITGKDPQLSPISSNGGPTQTMAPAASSPAVDAVPQARCASTDQRLVTRPADAGENVCDVGALENKSDPVTTVSLSGTAGSNGWFKSSPVSVKLSATDPGGDAISTTYYGIDGPATTAYSTPFSVSGDGDHLVNYDSVDANGNTETTKTAHVKIDTTAPTINGSITDGTLGTNQSGVGQWYTSPVTVQFNCADATPGSGLQTGSAGCTDDGPSPNTVTNKDGTESVTNTIGDTNGTTVTGTATDNAGNTNVAGNPRTDQISNILVDTHAPTASEAITSPANPSGTDNLGNAWYNTPVAIHWTCSDPFNGDPTSLLQGSGLVSCPHDSSGNYTFTGEGAGQTDSGLVADNAGNSFTATSEQVNIDMTAPVTGIKAADQQSWLNHDVTLEATDNLSGVQATYYAVYACNAQGQNCTGTCETGASSCAALCQSSTTTSGGQNCSDLCSPATTTCPGTQQGTSIAFPNDGIYRLVYWSVDYANNVETPQVATVKIDRTLPEITHTQNPIANSHGWNKGDVQVSFQCQDPTTNGVASGIKSCVAKDAVPAGGPSAGITIEGLGLTTLGTATDNAGNSADDTTVSVNIDRTAPNITASTGSYTPGAGNWTKGPVTVSFTCDDTSGTVHSGIQSCSSDTTNPSALSSVTLSGEGANQSVTGRAVDAAGNSTDRTVSGINIDTTAPTITADTGSYVPGTWTSTSVTVTFHCQDNTGGSGVSGLDEPKTFKETGAGQSVIGTCSDNAGNISHITVNNINIDTSTPTISPTFNGMTYTPGTMPQWFNVPVTVHWICSTSGPSGITSCPADKTYSKDGTGYSVQGTVTNGAGTSAQSSTYQFKIDRTPPVTTSSLGGYTAGTWSKTPVSVSLGATDALSGVKVTDVTIDGGKPHPYSSPISVSTDGQHTLQYWSMDNAGNSETPHTVGIWIDTTGPVITPHLTPSTAGDNGWYNIATGNPTISFTCTDAGSGVASCPGPHTFSSDGGGQTVTVVATDTVGNTNNLKTSPVNVDLTRPNITGSATVGGSKPPTLKTTGAKGKAKVTVATTTGTPYTPGSWTKGPVTVHFSCSDVTSGIASCPADQVFSGDGGNQQAQGTAIDRAGNTRLLTFGPINIANGTPTTTAYATPPANGAGWNNTPVTVRLSAVPAAISGGSGAPGIKTITYSINGGSKIVANGSTVVLPTISTNGVTQLSFFATDTAGNVESPAKTLTVRVDTTKPTITARAKTGDGKPYTPGTWTNGPVTVHFTCHAGMSGLAEGACPGDQTVSSEGQAQVVSGTVTNIAGTSANTLVSPVNIDLHAPQSSASVNPQPNGQGINTTAPTVTITAHDPQLAPNVNGSGVAAISYTVNGGKAVVVKSNQATIPISQVGTTQISYFATDVAGNAESPAHTLVVNYHPTR